MDPHAAYAAYSADPYGQHYAANPNAAAAHAGYAPAGSPYPPYSGHAAPAAGQAPSPYGEELRTVYISGFPADVKERELNNLLRFLPGYEASQMHWKNNQAQGFALFVNGPTARACRDAIQNLCFDDTAVLRCEMAHKNMYFKETDPSAKRPKHAGPAPGYEQYGGYPGYGYPPAPAAHAQPAAYQQVTNTKDNPPCNTLFIGNLGDHVSEQELRSMFSHQPGFSQLKMVRNSRNATCFVEFTDVASAMVVHQSQQGAVLQSSDRGGIRIQYSKNPFGKKRDASGQLVSLKSGEVTSEPPMHSHDGSGALPAADPVKPEPGM